jgi:hypothetical protein
MNKCFTILSLLLTFSGSSFHAYSSHPLIESEPSSSRSSSTLRYCLGGAILLASKVQSALAMQPTSTLDETFQERNSTGQPCVCPLATGTSAGDFYGNNVGVLATATFFSFLVAPRVNEWIITPTATYLWNRFCQTTIDDVPLLAEAPPRNLLKKAWKTLYEFAGKHSYQNKLRDYEAAGLPKKFVAEIKLIDEILTKKGWAKEELIRNKKFFGFSYANGSLIIQIRDSSVQELIQTQLDHVESQNRLNVWKEFADPLREENVNALLKAIPEKVYQAIGRLSSNSNPLPGVDYEKSADNSLVNIRIGGISIRIAKTYHNNVD